MKIKQLINELQDIVDRHGEDLHVCYGNCEISDVELLEAYYDGPQQIVETDEQGRPVSGKYSRHGMKVSLGCWTFSTLVWDRENFTIDYSDLDPDRARDFKANHDKIREESKAMDYRHDLEYFTKHVKKRAKQIMEDDEQDLDVICKTFFDEHYKVRNIPNYVPIKREGESWYMSYVDRKNTQWDMEVAVVYNGYGFELKKKEIPPTNTANNV